MIGHRRYGGPRLAKDRDFGVDIEIINERFRAEEDTKYTDVLYWQKRCTTATNREAVGASQNM